MWKDMLITKVLSSGLLALMITGCLEVTDDVKIVDNSNIVDTGFYEIQQEYDAGSYIKSVGFFNNQYVFISSSGSIFLSKKLNSDFTYNDTLKKATDRVYDFVNVRIVGTKLYCLTQYNLLSTSDLLSWDNCFSSGHETIKKGSYWKSKNKYIIQTVVDKENSALYIFDLDSQTYNRFSLGKIDSFLISDDYVFVYVLEDNLFYVTDGESLLPVNLSIPHADIGYTPFGLLASYNNKFYMLALSPTQPATGFNYDFYEVSYAGGKFKTTLLFSEKTLFYRIEYAGVGKELTPYGVVLNYENSLFLLDWDGNITDINPGSDKAENLTYFYYSEGLAYFTQAFFHTVYVSENLKDWKSFEIPLDSTHNGPYLYGSFPVNGLQIFLSVGYSTENYKYAIDIYKMEKISVGGCLKSLQERPYVQSYNLARTGYVKWNNGLLIQWGMANLSAVSNSTLTYSTITMPLSYNNTNAFGVFTQGVPSGSGQNHCCSWDGNRSANSFSVIRCYTGAEISWLAIGYV